MLELTLIRTIAAVHRGSVNLAIRTLRVRQKLADRKLASQLEFADDLHGLAAKTVTKAISTEERAKQTHVETVFKIRSAEHTVHNLRDDLDKIN